MGLRFGALAVAGAFPLRFRTASLTFALPLASTLCFSADDVYNLWHLAVRCGRNLWRAVLHLRLHKLTHSIRELVGHLLWLDGPDVPSIRFLAKATAWPLGVEVIRYGGRAPVPVVVDLDELIVGHFGKVSRSRMSFDVPDGCPGWGEDCLKATLPCCRCMQPDRVRLELQTSLAGPEGRRHGRELT